MVEITRREFMRWAGLMGGVSLFAGCHLFEEPAAVPKYIEGAPGVDPIETLAGIDQVYTVCGMCPGNCGICCRVAQGNLVKIGGNPFHPISVDEPLPFDTPLEKAVTRGGAVCAIGSSGIQYLYDPFRVVRPLKRVGPRGSGKWKALTWQQIVDEIVNGGDLFGEGRVAGLKEIKDSGQGLNFLAGRADWGAMRFLEGFVASFPGAAMSRDRAARLDAAAVEVARTVFGPTAGAVQPNYRNARFVLSFGEAPLDSGVPLVSIARDIANARVSGQSFRWAVVDPRMSGSAAKADMWLPVIPGRDLALVHGIMSALADLGVKAPSTGGAGKNPGIAAWAKECGIPAESIARVASLLVEAGSKSAVIPGRNILAQANGLEVAKAILALNLAVGSVPGSGGLVYRNDEFLVAAEKKIASQKPLPQASATKSYLTPVKALMVWSADPVYDDPSETESFLKDREKIPLLVCMDRHISETSTLADYILPDTTYLERWDICVSPPSVSHPGIGVRKPVVGNYDAVSGRYTPIFPETKPLEDIVGLLAGRLGLPGFEPDKDGNTLTASKYYRKLTGQVLESMKAAGFAVSGSEEDVNKVLQRGGVFAGKPLQLTPASQVQASALPIAKPPTTSYTGEDGLLLVSYSLPFHRTAGEALNSWLVEISPENRLQMNHSDAAKLGLEQHANVVLETADGKLSAKCRVLIVPGIRPGVVALAKGFGYRESGVRAHTIDQTSSEPDKTRSSGVNLARLISAPAPQFVRVRKA